MRQPLYATYATLPFGLYLQAQRIIRDNPAPKSSIGPISFAGLIDLVCLLYDITSEEADDIEVEEFWQLVHGIRPFWASQPIMQDVSEFEWQGIIYTFDRHPDDCPVRQIKHIEEQRRRFDDPLDEQLVALMLIAAPRGEDYGNGRSRFTEATADMIRQWPTTVCVSALAFFFRTYGLSGQLIRLCSAMKEAGIPMPDTAD